MSSLSLILRNTPAWATVDSSRPGFAIVSASPQLEGGKPPRTFSIELRISTSGGIKALEQPEHRQWPSSCLERHINPDSSFCVFYGSESRIEDDEQAALWWSHLASYINNQVYADRYKVWPQGAGLSHGDAAVEQVAMEILAGPLGWKEELWQGMFRSSGWLAENLPRISKDKTRVVNSRSPCPRGCTRKHKGLRKHSCAPGCKKTHRPILRADCPHRESVEQIILHEHRRRAIEREMVQKLYQQGHRCCGTMKQCPLRELHENAP